VELIHERLPNAGIGADVIAGFPGETDEEHAETLAFVRALPFSYLHVFSFSQRPGTRAAELPNQVPAPVVKSRARELRALGEKKCREFRQSQAGRELRVLTLRRRDDTATPALSSNYLQMWVRGNFAPNEWLDATFMDADRSIAKPALEAATNA
jgi:threonylcarbamoyladenosine tRNA methylthiotransferase MtaB